MIVTSLSAPCPCINCLADWIVTGLTLATASLQIFQAVSKKHHQAVVQSLLSNRCAWAPKRCSQRSMMNLPEDMWQDMKHNAQRILWPRSKPEGSAKQEAEGQAKPAHSTAGQHSAAAPAQAQQQGAVPAAAAAAVVVAAADGEVAERPGTASTAAAGACGDVTAQKAACTAGQPAVEEEGACGPTTISGARMRCAIPLLRRVLDKRCVALLWGWWLAAG